MLDKLKLLRQSRGISQQKLADMIHVSQQSVNKYENHNIEPDIETLIKIADYFNVSVDYLIGRTDVQRRADALTLDDITATEEYFIREFMKLNDKQKKCILTVMESYRE